ncbi:hypothetical protein Acr_27g0000850 [Actinidia rufa]|uniref:Uncharacterized protein n=1 Tax=Actinidia rufa TaxID=165716 RepID=A0A7J0H5G9_9ERIC|nr:hypothetical protein Acr_27g0000850 [Actinidia rufa]
MISSLNGETEPLFPKKVIRTRVSSKFKLPTQLEGVRRKNGSNGPPRLVQKFDDTSDILEREEYLSPLHGPPERWGELKGLCQMFQQAILEVEDVSDKVVIMAMMEGLCPGPLFDSLSKNVLETQSALQSKADKYIVAKELVEAKRIRRGKDDHKRKEPDTMQSDYRDYMKSKRYDGNRPIVGDIQVIHGRFGTGGCSSSRERHTTEANRRAKVDVYNPSADLVVAHSPITFTNDDLRDLHLPHDDALVICTTIADFNVQRILVDNGSSTDILFISAFDKIKIR